MQEATHPSLLSFLEFLPSSICSVFFHFSWVHPVHSPFSLISLFSTFIYLVHCYSHLFICLASYSSSVPYFFILSSLFYHLLFPSLFFFSFLFSTFPLLKPFVTAQVSATLHCATQLPLPMSTIIKSFSFIDVTLPYCIYSTNSHISYVKK